jgi:hypothetical protein
MLKSLANHKQWRTPRSKLYRSRMAEVTSSSLVGSTPKTRFCKTKTSYRRGSLGSDGDSSCSREERVAASLPAVLSGQASGTLGAVSDGAYFLHIGVYFSGIDPSGVASSCRELLVVGSQCRSRDTSPHGERERRRCMRKLMMVVSVVVMLVPLVAAAAFAADQLFYC